MISDAHRPLATGGRRAWCALLLAATASAATSPSDAAGLALRFDDCIAGPAAAAVRTHVCQLVSPPVDLFVSLSLDVPVDSVLALEVVIDLQHASASLPDWWRLEPGGCRAGKATASADFSAAPDCADPWAPGAALALLQTIAPGQPRGGANQLRLISTVGVTPDEAATFPAGAPLHAMRLRIDGSTAGPVNPSCVGCTADACLVLNSIKLVRTPLAADLVVTHAGPAGDHRVQWQGAGADCLAVPVRNVTWGRIKGLYHGSRSGTRP